MKNFKFVILGLLVIGIGTTSCKKDEECVVQTWYADADGDGFGDVNATKMSCDQPEGYVKDNTDCNDTDNTILSTKAGETWYADTDGDGFGDASSSKVECMQPTGYVLDNTDCDDANDSIYPGATDAPNDGVDSNCDGAEETVIWTGTDLVFEKITGTDWTMAANQDKLTDKVIFTRQDKKPFYNYQWWQDQFTEDVTGDDLQTDFWDGTTIKDFIPSGGTKGVRWAILDDTGADSPWSTGFNLYGTLGDSTHFYSFHNIATIIKDLNNGYNVTEVLDDFKVERGNGNSTGSTKMTDLVGKKLGVWLVEEDIYLTLSFTKWGTNDDSEGGHISYTRSTK